MVVCEHGGVFISLCSFGGRRKQPGGSFGLKSGVVSFTLAFLCLGVFSPEADAHSAGNSPSSNYLTSIESIRATPSSGIRKGFRLRSIEAGSRLELRWLSGPEIVVPDYDDHPYLRIGSRGAFVNTQSNAYYLNRDRNGATPLPTDLHPEGPPTWLKLSTEPVARWHDHRAHLMGGEPPNVAADPGHRHTVQEESVTFSQGKNTFDAAVRVSWVPGPNATPLLIGAGAIAMVLTAWGWWAMRRGRRLKTFCSVLLGLLIVVDAFHLTGIAFGIQGTFTSSLARMFSVGFVSIAAWLIGLISMYVLVRRKNTDGFYLAAFSAAFITLVGGLADFAVLYRTSIPFAFPVTLARWSVIGTLALGVTVVVTAVRSTRPEPVRSDNDD